MNLLKMISAVVLLTALNAQADELRTRAITGQTADVVVTAAGLALVDGVKEANPLGVVIIPVKLGLLYWAGQIEDPAERADVHRALSATGWGPVAHNLCTLGVVASGGGNIVPCAILGIVTGLLDWRTTAGMRDKAIADTMCARGDLSQCALATPSPYAELYIN